MAKSAMGLMQAPGGDNNLALFMMLMLLNQNRDRGRSVWQEVKDASEAISALVGLKAQPDPSIETMPNIPEIPENRRITWQRQPGGGFLAENVPVAENPAPDSKNPLSQFEDFLNQFDRSAETMGRVAERLGYQRQSQNGSENYNRPTLQMPLKIGEQVGTVNMPLDNPSSIFEYSLKSAQLDREERVAKDRNTGLFLLLSWLAGRSPTEVAKLAQQKVTELGGKIENIGFGQSPETFEITCDKCQGKFTIQGTPEGLSCPYCHTPLGATNESQGSQEGRTESE